MKHLLEDIRPLTKTSNFQEKHEEVLANNLDLKYGDFGSIGTKDFKKTHKGLWFVIFLIIFISVVAFVSFYFRTATVSITPKSEVIEIDTTVVLGSSNDSSSIPYEIMTITDFVEKEKTGSVNSKLEIEASGKVIIYNSFSTATQKLVSGTRFETKDKKIFKLRSDVIVPGRTTKDGKVVPGAIEATLYAEKAGELYNVGLVDLYILAYRGTSRYSTLYARAKDPISGGKTGEAFSLSKEEAQFVEAELVSALTFQMQTDAFKQIPEGFKAFKDSFAEKIEVDTSSTASDPKIKVTAKGTLSLLIIKEADIVSYLVKNNLKDFKEEDLLYIKNWDSLSLELEDKNKLLDQEKTSLKAKIKGSVNIIWQVNIEEVRNKILSIDNSSFSDVVNSITGVSSAKLEITPFWIRTTPDKTSKINIELVQ
jgi:hypothetical protein